MKPFKTSRRWLALAALLGGGSALAAGWTITDLGPITTGEMALNDNGWVVVGNRVLSPTDSGYASTVVRSADGSLNNLRLRDINNHNVVLGVDASQGAWHAFTWQAGLRSNLPEHMQYTGAYQSTAASLNDNGQIAGNTGDIAYQWSPNGSGGYLMTGMGVDLGSTIGSGEAMAINSAGAVLMHAVYPTGRAGYSFGIDHTTIIPELAGYQPVGLALNDQYQVAGAARYDCNGYSCNRPFVWQGPEVAWMPVTPAAPGWYISGEARGLNERGQAVGGAYVAAYDRRALLWTLGAGGWSTTDLNTLLPAGSPFWKLGDAMDINERGQILGLGSVQGDNSFAHVFLLTPVPEPAAWALMLIGCAALLAWIEPVGPRRRRRGPAPDRQP